MLRITLSGGAVLYFANNQIVSPKNPEMAKVFKDVPMIVSDENLVGPLDRAVAAYFKHIDPDCVIQGRLDPWEQKPEGTRVY